MKTNASINYIGIVMLIAGLKAHAQFYGTASSGPTAGSPVTAQVAVLASGSTGSCPYAGAPSPDVPISGTVSGQSITTYTLSANGNASNFGLSGSWSTQTTAGQSGSAGMTINTWCTAHNVDAAETTITSTYATWDQCNGIVSDFSEETLVQVTSYFPRCPGNPDSPQPATPPCNPNCPPAA
jgi:hypothetical protein